METTEHVPRLTHSVLMNSGSGIMTNQQQQQQQLRIKQLQACLEQCHAITDEGAQWELTETAALRSATRVLSLRASL